MTTKQENSFLRKRDPPSCFVSYRIVSNVNGCAQEVVLDYLCFYVRVCARNIVYILLGLLFTSSLHIYSVIIHFYCVSLCFGSKSKQKAEGSYSILKYQYRTFTLQNLSKYLETVNVSMHQCIDFGRWRRTVVDNYATNIFHLVDLKK